MADAVRKTKPRKAVSPTGKSAGRGITHNYYTVNALADVIETQTASAVLSAVLDDMDRRLDTLNADADRLLARQDAVS